MTPLSHFNNPPIHQFLQRPAITMPAVGTADKDARVEDYLNDKFQAVADLDSLDSLLTSVQSQQLLLRSQLQEAEVDVEKARAAADEHANTVLTRAQNFKKSQSDISQRLRATVASDTAQDASQLFEQSMGKLRQLDIATAYVSLILEVNELSDEARKHIQADPKAALVPYSKLQHLEHSLKARHAQSEDAAIHLVDYVDKTTKALWDEMKAKLAGQFEEVLNKMKWPNPNPEIEKFPEFTKGFEKLLILQIPELEDDANDKPLLPLEVMLKPLELRFRYHFEGDRQTNRIDKPEWFLSHISTLITTYSPFLTNCIQPILSSNDSPSISLRDAITEFITALLPALRRKIHNLLPQILDQAQLLSHFIHEMIKFDTGLREDFLYVPYGSNEVWKGITHEVLVVQGGFAGWLKVEKEFALLRYHSILSAEDAWQIDYDSLERNETKPTKSAMRLKDLLETITDRYRPLISFSQRLKFLIEIQIAILDQYHDRLSSSVEAFKVLSSSIARAVQGTSKEEAASLSGVGGLERLCKVYGSAMFLENTMRDWGEDIFFLELWEELQGRAQTAQRNSSGALTGTMNVQEVANVTSSAVVSGGDDGALFDETAEAYKNLRTRTEEMIVELIAGSLRDELKPYSRIIIWTSLDLDRTEVVTSPELVTPLASLASFLSFASRTLSPAVFRRIFHHLSLSLQSWLMENVIMRNQFSLAGGRQFVSDMNGIWNVCGRFVEEPESGMKKIKEACLLLTLENGDDSAIRLWEVVKAVFEDNGKARTMLERLGIDNLGTTEVRGILQRRVEAWA